MWMWWREELWCSAFRTAARSSEVTAQGRATPPKIDTEGDWEEAQHHTEPEPVIVTALTWLRAGKTRPGVSEDCLAAGSRGTAPGWLPPCQSHTVTPA